MVYQADWTVQSQPIAKDLSSKAIKKGTSGVYPEAPLLTMEQVYNHIGTLSTEFSIKIKKAVMIIK